MTRTRLLVIAGVGLPILLTGTVAQLLIGGSGNTPRLACMGDTELAGIYVGCPAAPCKKSWTTCSYSNDATTPGDPPLWCTAPGCKDLSGACNESCDGKWPEGFRCDGPGDDEYCTSEPGGATCTETTPSGECCSGARVYCQTDKYGMCVAEAGTHSGPIDRVIGTACP